MEQQNKIVPMDDEALDQAVGGYFEVSKWRRYVSETVIPALNRLLPYANSGEQQIINRACSVFMSTQVPDAPISGPVSSLWQSYNLTYRSQIETPYVKDVLGQILSQANTYIRNNS